MKPICFSPIILLLVISCGTSNKNSKEGDTFSEEIYNKYFSSVLTAISEDDQQALKESFVFDFEDSTLSVWNYDIVEKYIGRERHDSLIVAIDLDQELGPLALQVKGGEYTIPDKNSFRRFLFGDAFNYLHTDTTYSSISLLQRDIKNFVVLSTLPACQPCMASYKDYNTLGKLLEEENIKTYAIFFSSKEEIEGYQSFKPYMDKYGFLEHPWIIGYNKNSLFFRDVIGTFEMPHLILYRSKEVKHLDLTEFEDYQFLYDYIISFFES